MRKVGSGMNGARRWHARGAVTRAIAAYPNPPLHVSISVAQFTVTSATTLVFAAFAAFSEDEAPEPGFAGLTPQHAIGQSLAGGRATSMGQRDRGQLESAPEVPVVAVAPASDAGAELRPVDAIMDRYAQGD